MGDIDDIVDSHDEYVRVRDELGRATITMAQQRRQLTKAGICQNCGRRLRTNSDGIMVCWVCAFPVLREIDAAKENSDG